MQPPNTAKKWNVEVISAAAGLTTNLWLRKVESAWPQRRVQQVFVLHSCYDAVSLISLLLWLLPSCSRVIREVRAALGSSKTISLTSLGKFDLGTNNADYSYKMEMTNNVIVASHPYLDYITGNMNNHKNCLQRNTSQTLSSTVYVYVQVYISLNIFCIFEQEDFCFTSNEV